MALHHNPRIVTSGLVLALDAGDINSYPGSGTTWYDVSGTNNGTLTNGPTFNSGNGGSIVFDGVDDFIKVTHNGSLDFNSSDFTTVNWCRIDGGSGTYRSLFQNSVGETSTRQFGLVGATNNKWGVWMTINNIWDSRLFSSSGIILGAWTMVTVTYKNNSNLNIYVNGVLDATTPISGNLTYNPTVMNIGKRYSAAEFFNGPIATGLIYNRTLTAQEVLQNYLAQKSRFGL